MIDRTVFTTWRKSSRNDGGDNCVEVVFALDGTVGVRHSRDPEGAVLVFTSGEWEAFTGAVQDRRGVRRKAIGIRQVWYLPHRSYPDLHGVGHAGLASGQADRRAT
jgi:hypothetical protein